VPDTFTPTGSMTVARFEPKATLLQDGRVLITGGGTGAGLGLATVELYDPAAGVFVQTGSMAIPRYGHTATLLSNGKVLTAGGAPKSNAPSASAELYDPATGSFESLNDMNFPRYLHSATLLRNGKVLIAGGFSSPSSETASAEIYDPETGTFTPAGSMTTARWNPRAIRLASGKVLILPDSDGGDYASAEVYHPDEGAFSTTDWEAVQLGALVAMTANLLPDGRVLVTLAPPECEWLDTHGQLYDPVAGTFAATENGTGLCGQTGTFLSDGTVLVAGGWGTAGDAEIYVPRSGSFAPTGKLTNSRYAQSATLLLDGRVLIAGGFRRTGTYGVTAEAELYTPRSAVPPPSLLPLPGTSQGAILHSDTHRIVSPQNPARPGEALEIYATGLLDGAVVSPDVSIGGHAADVLYFGHAPGFPTLNQINVRVPVNLSPGSSIPVRLNYFDRPSNEVMLAAQ
jgi:hypothetical protein